jgi:sensor c-di-GMP phosphodiesterase-like protein
VDPVSPALTPVGDPTQRLLEAVPALIAGLDGPEPTVRAVVQPLVRLLDGAVIGFEALGRVVDDLGCGP